MCTTILASVGLCWVIDLGSSSRNRNRNTGILMSPSPFPFRHAPSINRQQYPLLFSTTPFFLIFHKYPSLPSFSPTHSVFLEAILRSCTRRSLLANLSSMQSTGLTSLKMPKTLSSKLTLPLAPTFLSLLQLSLSLLSLIQLSLSLSL